MIWHILTIVFGILVAVSAICPSPWSDVVLGVLVAVFGGLALMSFRKSVYD
jgi:hypothetical protein